MSELPFGRMVAALLFAFAPGLVIGAVVYAILTIAFTPAGSRTGPPDSTILTIFVIAVVVLVIPFARSVGAGFLLTLLLATVALDRHWSKPWWEPIGRVVSRATAPAREAAERKRAKEEWLVMWKDTQLDVDVAIFRAHQYAEGCVQKTMAKRPDGSVPTAAEFTTPSDCADFTRDAADIPAEWPKRFHKEADKGWRWTVTSDPTRSRWGTPGFRITFRPESLLQRAGPILEIDGQDLVRIREDDQSPWRVVGTPIPMMKKLRECLLIAGAAYDDSVTWSMLPASDNRKECPNLRLNVGGSYSDDGGLVVEVSERLPEGSAQKWSESTWISYKLLAPHKFELRAANHYRRFLLSADGTAHLTTEARPATTSDGPPLPCELDPSLHCD